MIKKIHLILLILCSYSLVLSGQVENYSAGLNGQKLDWLLFYLNEHYVDQVDEEFLTEKAILSIVQELDIYSVYQNKEDAEKQANADRGYSGKATGFNFYVLRDTAIVTYISQGGPAEKAGLLKGDRLLTMNGQSIVGPDVQKLRDRVKDKDLEDFAFDVLRKDEPAIQLSFNKALIPWKSVNAAYMVTETVGYIKLGKFTVNTVDEFTTSLKYLLSIGLKELILDLRDNRGGIVAQAYALADIFLPEGKLIYKEASVNMNKDFHTTGLGLFESGKLVIMQNANTASASEIFIGALQDWDRAVVLGTSTYGKGLIQQSFKLGDGSNIRITTGRYKTPTGRVLQRKEGTDNNDWMTPYQEALRKNSLTAKLTNIAENLKGQSMSGRYLVTGPGGIVPGVYYVWEDNEEWDLYNALNNKGYLYEFTTKYTDQHRSKMQFEYPTVKAFHEDRIREAFMLKDFRNYLASKNPGMQLPRNFPENVIFQIKKWMASQLWHDNAFHEMDNMNDRVLWRAREIQEGRVHEILGIKY